MSMTNDFLSFENSYCSVHMTTNFCLDKDEWLNFSEWDGIQTM